MSTRIMYISTYYVVDVARMTQLKGYNVRAAGIPWFRKEDYAAILAIMENSYDFLPIWEDWLKRAEKDENFLKGKGYIVERIYIDPDTFIAWCKKAGCRVDSKACERFSIDAVKSKYNRTH